MKKKIAAVVLGAFLVVGLSLGLTHGTKTASDVPPNPFSTYTVG